MLRIIYHSGQAQNNLEKKQRVLEVLVEKNVPFVGVTMLPRLGEIWQNKVIRFCS